MAVDHKWEEKLNSQVAQRFTETSRETVPFTEGLHYAHIHSSIVL